LSSLTEKRAKKRKTFLCPAEERQKAAGKKHGSRQKVVENLPQAIEGKSRDQVGAAVGVNGRHVDMVASRFTMLSWMLQGQLTTYPSPKT